MRRRIFLILFLFLIIFCVQGRVLADLSHSEKVDVILAKLFYLRSSEYCIKTELIPVECVVENNIIIEKVVRSIMEKLLKGPTEEERERLDLWTVIPEGVKINNIYVEEETKTVFIDFSKEMNAHGGGSYPAIYIRLMVEMTLEELPSIEEVVITVEGKDERDGVLQP